MFRKTRYFFRFLLLIFLAHHFFWESTPKAEKPNEQLYELLSLQRQVDRYSPLSENNLQGTHNSYNTDVYHTLFRYHDRQQHLSLGEQLKYGARFLELDVHWTFSFWSMQQDLLLCHGSDKFNFLPFHWGCSPFDKPLAEGLQEVEEWLSAPENKQELLIFYIEDHADGHHQYLHELLEKHRIAQAMIESGGCTAIPDTLTKNDLITQGKQIVFWKDGACSNFEPLGNLAYGDLGNLLRQAEDRTFLGTLDKHYVRGLNPRIEKEDVTLKFSQGANIVNLDEFAINDERLFSVLWSWEYVESDISEVTMLGETMNDGCAQQKSNGKWIIENCELELLHAACFNWEMKEWRLTEALVNWQAAEAECKKHLGFVFSAPTNYLENKALAKQTQQAKPSKSWLNIQKHEQTIVVGDKRQHN